MHAVRPAVSVEKDKNLIIGLFQGICQLETSNFLNVFYYCQQILYRLVLVTRRDPLKASGIYKALHTSILSETQWLNKGYDLLYIWSQKRKPDEKYLCLTEMFLEANARDKKENCLRLHS